MSIQNSLRKSLFAFLLGQYPSNLPLHHQQQSRLMNVLLLVFIPAIPFIPMLQSLGAYGTLDGYFHRPLFWITTIGSLAFGVCYILNRIGQYALARWLILIVAAVIITLQAEISDFPQISILYLLTLPVFGLGIFTQPQMIAVSVSVSMFLAWFMFRHSRLTAAQSSEVVVLMLILLLLLIIVSYHRNQLEARRSNAMAEKELQLRLLLAQIPAQIWALDLHLVRISTIGSDADESLILALRADPNIQPALKNAVTGQRQVFEHVWQSLPFRTYLEPLRDAENVIIGCIGMSLDISTEKREAAQDIALVGERERVRVLAEFLESASHDIRTPLSILNISLTLLERETQPEKRRYHFDVLSQTLKRLEKTLESMFVMTRLDTLPQYVTQLTNIASLIETVVVSQMTLATAQKVQLTSELQTNLPSICLHNREFSMALGHIVRNALQNTPADGVVTIAADTQEGHLIITISDTGAGIPQDEMQRVFDRFYRLEKHRPMDDTRIGMGLSVAKRVVEKHNGKIELTSELGRGTSVHIQLPLDASCL